MTLLLSLALSATGWAGLRDELLALTGGQRVKIVWQEDTTTRGLNVSGNANVFQLKGYDTRTDAVFDIGPVLDDYSKPMITHDGRRVVFSDIVEKRVYVVDWEGSNRRSIAGGSHGAVWFEAATGKEWVYYQPGHDGGNHDAPLRRVNLDDPGEDQLVWTGTPTQTQYIGISADGSRIGGCFPYDKCGLIEPDYRGAGDGRSYFSGGEPAYYSDGCWATITPDDTYRVAILRPNHREWAVWDPPVAPGAGPNRVVDLAAAPGIDGAEIYQPRLSNHPHFFTLSGPYIGGVGRGKATRARIEIFFGKLDPAFSRVAGWVRVSRDDRASYYPHAWVDPEPGGGRAASPVREAPSHR